jgi:hypothetical protein
MSRVLSLAMDHLRVPALTWKLALSVTTQYKKKTSLSPPSYSHPARITQGPNSTRSGSNTRSISMPFVALQCSHQLKGGGESFSVSSAKADKARLTNSVDLLLVVSLVNAQALACKQMCHRWICKRRVNRSPRS